MCIFSGPIKVVADTNIFARRRGAEQLLAYSMKFASDAELAMVLPIPTPAGAGEKAVRFVNLEGYPRFFEDLEAGMSQDTLSLDDEPAPAPLLEVHKVGAFEASFVPDRASFARLDSRFRIPDAALAGRAPEDGFVVFKLARSQKPTTAHPMAFAFPSRLEGQLYFPTVHVHDGSKPKVAEFDHHLYCQPGVMYGNQAKVEHFLEQNGDDWEAAAKRAGGHVDIQRAAGLVAGNDLVFRRRIEGDFENEDVLVSL